MITEFAKHKTPKVGDYVLVHISGDLHLTSYEISYVNTHTLKIRDIYDNGETSQYLLEIDNDEIDKDVWIFEDEVVWFGEEYVDVDTINHSNKYNL